MIRSFVESWPLFADAYVAGWLLAALLGLLGVQIVARDQIFFGAAVAQASTLGIACSLVVGALHPFGLHLHGNPVHARVWAVALSGLAAVGIELVSGRRETREAATGFVFLAGSSLSILLVAHSPFGLDEIQRLLSSSLIGARRADAWIFGGLLLATALGVASQRDRLLLLAMDPAMAAAIGMPVRIWSIGLALLLAIVVGLGIRVAGLPFVFGCLVLPALVAKQMSRTLASMLWRSPAIAGATAIAGFLLAHRFDVPPAHMTVGLQCLLLVAVWSAGAFRRPAWIGS